MLIEPIQPPLVGTLPPMPAGGATAAARARMARGLLDHGVRQARRPGAVDQTPAIKEALAAATDAIREAIEACGELHPVRHDLHLALDEANHGLAQLTATGAEAKTVAIRRANLAGNVLDRAIAALDEHAATGPAIDDPVQ
jgi:hypothetical protein